MANDINVVPGDTAHGDAEPSLGELFRQLAQDSATLFRQEVVLAKAEMRENVRGMASAAVLMAIGGGALLLAALALTAFVIALLGHWFGNQYWLSALLVGVLYAIIGAVLVARGKKTLQANDLTPDRTLQTLNDDKRWMQSEARQIRRDLNA